MKKRARWLAIMLAAVITMSQVGEVAPMKTVAAYETTTVEDAEMPDVENPDVDVENPDVDVENPDVDVENPDVDVENPDVDVENPDVDVENPDVDTENPDEEVKEPEITTPGWYRKGDDWYYNDAAGNKVLGWQYIGSAWYYFDGNNTEKPGVMLYDCKQEIEGRTYFFRANGAMQTGWVQREEGWYYAAGSGAMLTGWQLIGSRWYYLDAANEAYPGLMAADCKKEIHYATYFFNAGGAMITGWAKRAEGWYYTNASGAMLTGWQLVGSQWYYLDAANEAYPGLMAADCKQYINNGTYFFDKNGVMQKKWVQRPEGWYYTADFGAMLTGWQLVGSQWYYLDANNETYPGLMVCDCKMVINNYTYRFKANGAMYTGWCLDGEDWYYLNASGLEMSGWQRIGGYWYYLNPNNGNKMEANGWEIINGEKYYFNINGAMTTDWLLLDGDWYYLGTDGAMKTGWQLVRGRWYYMYKADDPNGGPEGVMAKNTTIEGYELSESGAMLTQADFAARNILNQIGYDLRAAFNWSAGLTYKTMTANASPGSEWFAMYGFENRKGNCYVMAATFYYFARQLGYEVHQMSGGVRNRNGGLAPHSWCEVIINGTTYVFDPSFENGTGGNGYQITYGAPGTWVYAEYSRMN